MLINAGIIRIVYEGEYPDQLAIQMLSDANIKTEQYSCDVPRGQASARPGD